MQGRVGSVFDPGGHPADAVPESARTSDRDSVERTRLRTEQSEDASDPTEGLLPESTDELLEPSSDSTGAGVRPDDLDA